MSLNKWRFGNNVEFLLCNEDNMLFIKISKFLIKNTLFPSHNKKHLMENTLFPSHNKKNLMKSTLSLLHSKNSTLFPKRHLFNDIKDLRISNFEDLFVFLQFSKFEKFEKFLPFRKLIYSNLCYNRTCVCIYLTTFLIISIFFFLF